MDLAATVERLGSVATRAQLLAAGAHPHWLTAAVREGSLLRIRRAWYATPDAPADRRIAVALGGRLGSMSALRSHGVWAIKDRRVHVSWPVHGNVANPGRRLAYPERHEFGRIEVVPHWRARRDREESTEPWRESVEQALAQAIRSEPEARALAAIDSALHRGLVSPSQLPWIADGLPASGRALISLADGRPDSGIESIVRFALTTRGLPVRIHPVLHGLEVDLLVGRSLVIETDGEEFHSDPEAFERDRQRDATLSSHGYIVVRFSYRQVVDAWPTCDARLLAHIARGDHLRTLD